jgi:two-component system alkaline phosphatase synthesis response regulator PhoP
MKQHHKKVLIIEDEHTLLLVLGEKFRREGFTVLEARDGLQGLEVATKHHPNIILLDIIMPSMDGLTMLKKLREDKWGNEVPVIILSNLGDPEQINEAAGGGVIKYLIKSNWSLEDVVDMVHQTLKAK